MCVLDVAGNVLGEREFEHGGAGLSQIADRLLSFAAGDEGEVSVAIETPRGPVVESLMERGFAAHSINPKQLDRFRDRFSPAGAKDDRRDARVLASALRTDPHCLRRLEPDRPGDHRVAGVVASRRGPRAALRTARRARPPPREGPAGGDWDWAKRAVQTAGGDLARALVSIERRRARD